MPSGPKKRKAAKKKMESLAVSTTIRQGNGGSGSEAASPMSPDHGDRLDDNKGGDGGGGGDVWSGGMENSRNGAGRAVDEHPIVPQKAEEALAVPLVSERAAVAPVSQPEDVGDEHVEPAKAVVASITGDEILIPAKPVKAVVASITGDEILIPAKPVKAVVASITGDEILIPAKPVKAVSEVKSESSVPGASAVHHPPAPAAVGKEVAAQDGDVAVEKVENLSLRQQPPSEERERKVEALGSGAGEAEQKSAGALQESEGGIHHHPQRENRDDDGTEVVSPSRAAQPPQRTSWLSCCGLFDALAGSG